MRNPLRRRCPDPPATRHPFFDVCPHGVQFLTECDQCPGGWQPQAMCAGLNTAENITTTTTTPTERN